MFSRPAEDGASRGPQPEPAEKLGFDGGASCWAVLGHWDTGAFSATHSCCRVHVADGAVRNHSGPEGLQKVRIGMG